MTKEQMARAAERSVEQGRFPNMTIARLWQVFIQGNISDTPSLEWFYDEPPPKPEATE